ncbi:MAG: sigma-54-dependent Fis family transcriptional regulator [Sandaracinus sp.]|nr:sigma-54-dependent Fis family transcriptional regulator [Myxococcales bacterium]MAT29231.1 sigma-54-dependent Fis family transcriptional regulator [Sandaracinus sp.]
MWGASPAMAEAFSLLERVAPTDLGVLLLGETGTGKELAARGLHGASGRGEGPFVVVDCGAIQPNLIESELFGHEKAAFTGADRLRVGAFEAADGGTVFLDEIGELPLSLQPKLLRVLERREVQRLGSSSPRTVDVRLVAATHRDLAGMVRDGGFREDLYFRLAEMEVRLPPLRDRAGDVALLAERILAELAEVQEDEPKGISAEALARLEAHPWPGNVRQLRNVLRRAAVMASGPTLGPEDLDALPTVRATPSAAHADVDASLPLKEARDKWNAPLERRYLEEVLQRHGGDLDAAASHVEMHRKSLERLLRRHDLKASDYR